MHDGSAAKSFLLRRQATIEITSAVLVRYAEVKIAAAVVNLCEQMIDQSVKRSHRPAPRRIHHILCMHGRTVVKDDGAREHRAVLLRRIELDVIGKSSREQFQFLCRMDGNRTVTLLQNLAQQVDKCRIIMTFLQNHPVLMPLLDLTCAAFAVAVTLRQKNCRRHIAAHEPRPMHKKSIQILLCRIAMVYPRHALVKQRPHAMLAQETAHLAEKVDHRFRRHALSCEETAEGQAAMRNRRLRMSRQWQEREQAILFIINKHRCILKTRLMILHIITQKKKVAVLRLADEIIPKRSIRPLVKTHAHPFAPLRSPINPYILACTYKTRHRRREHSAFSHSTHTIFL